MKDPRMDELAGSLVKYSVELNPGELVYIEVKGMEALELGKALVEAASKAGAVPFWYYNDEDISRPFVEHATKAQFEKWGQFHKGIMQQVDAYIAVRGSSNPYNHSDLPEENVRDFSVAYWNEVHSVRVNEKKWCVLRFPNPTMAVLAGRSTRWMEDFYYRVCTLDYSLLSQAMDPLVALMENTDKVQITGPGTDISFSIKGLGAVKCDGHRNIPDGEVYSCPVKDSVNGVVTYNAPSMYRGATWRDVKLTVKDGRIVEATCAGDDAKLNAIFDTDDGARYFGEFALGLNPHIDQPLQDILFDEKIGGSFHLTPGNAYEKTDNGNKSAVHWDLVNIQTESWGGGEIYFDGRLIRKNGLFVAKELEGLNPEMLLKG